MIETKVKCVNDKGTKLVQGAEYIISWYSPSGDKVGILKMSRYTISRFRLLNGKELNSMKKNISWYQDNGRNSNIRVDEDDLNKLVLCSSSNNSKKLIEGNYYKIIDLKYETYNYGSGRSGNKYLSKVKIEGYTNWFSPYRFTKLPKQDQRNVNLTDLVGGEIIQLKQYDRKFDALTEDQKQTKLFSLIVEMKKEITEMGYNKSVIELILHRDKIWGIREEDFDEIKKIKIRDLIN